MRNNELMTEDSRFSESNTTTEFIDYDDIHSDERTRRQKIEGDKQIIFRQKFALSREIIYYSYYKEGLLKLIANVGGLSKLLIAFFGFLAKYFNDRIMVAK